MKLPDNIAGLLLAGLLTVFVTGCASTHNGSLVVINDPNLVIPSLEGVQYTKWSAGYTNELVLVVNTGRNWMGKEAYWDKKCDRCSYSLTLTKKSNTFTERDMEIRISARPSERSFKPKYGLVTIMEKQPDEVIAFVSIDDDRLPRLINGAHILKTKEATADRVCYGQ